MMRRFLMALALFPGLAHGQVDVLEHVEGATHMSAIAGDGGLSVCAAPTGTLTQLLWPSPLGTPQLRYETEASPNARTLPRFGASETDGLFSGLWVQTNTGPVFTWLRDTEWTHTQTYSGTAITQTATHSTLGLRVIQLTGAQGDTFYQRTIVERDDASGITDVSVVTYSDLQVEQDESATWWDADGNRVVSFAIDGPVSDALTGVAETDWVASDWNETGAPVAEAESAGRDGTFITLGGAIASSVHIGELDDCLGVGTPSAFAAVQASDATTTGSSGFISLCDADVALVQPVEFKNDGPVDRGAVDVFAAFATDLVGAANALEGARAQGFEALLADADADANARRGHLSLLSNASTQGANAFTHQWAASVSTIADRSGAFAASLASQPRFHVDRPAESAWTELALELAGDFDAVSAHQRWLAEQQLTDTLLDDDGYVAPPGVWPTDRATLDMAQVGLTAWSLYRHGTFAGNERKARTTLASTWPTLSRAADLLAGCVASDHPALTALEAEVPDTFPDWWPLFEHLAAGESFDVAAGLSAGANGDWDQLRPCASDVGALDPEGADLLATNLVRLGLVSAIAAADALCIDDARTTAWQARADELAAVLLAADYDGSLWSDGGALVAWPSVPSVSPGWWFAFAASSDPEVAEAEVDAYIEGAMEAWVDQEHRRVLDAVTLQTDGRGDEALALLEGAMWRATTGDRLVQSQARALLGRLVTDLATPGTLHLGAAFVGVDESGTASKRADQRVGQPYVPAASMAVAALITYEDRSRLDPITDVLELTCPEGQEPELQRVAPDCNEDCQNSMGGRSRGTAALTILFALLVVRRRRRS